MIIEITNTYKNSLAQRQHIINVELEKLIIPIMQFTVMFHYYIIIIIIFH